MFCAEEVSDLDNHPVVCLFDTRMRGTSTEMITQGIQVELPTTTNTRGVSVNDRDLGAHCHGKEYKGTRYSDGDRALVVELWLHRVADDLSGLTFQEWDPSAGSDDTSAPVAMFVNSSELHAADFPLTEVRPLQLDTVDRGGRRTCGESVRKFQGVGNSTFVLSVENDNDFRSRCE
jgi:hypothetical protein